MSSSSEIVGSLLEDILACDGREQRSRLESLCSEYPELATRLRELFRTFCLIENNKPTLQKSNPSTPSISHVNAVLGEYRVLREIARGGMGVVYEAIHSTLGRKVALKVIMQHLLHEPTARARFRQEAKAAALLHHSNIVPVFDVGQSDEVSFYAMQFISGCSLDRIIEADRKTTNEDALGESKHSIIDPFRQAASLGLQIADALSYAHGKNILHRDVKPSNILVDESGTAWITDFGLAKISGVGESSSERSNLTNTGNIVGTLRYLAPERLQGVQDPRVDIYGLGASLYELVAKQPLFENSDQVQLVAKISHSEPTRLKNIDPKVPRDLETIIHKCIAKDPNFRYQTASALVEDLRRFLDDLPILSRRLTWIEHSLLWSRRNPVVSTLITISLSLLLIVTIGGVFMHLLRRQRDSAIELYERTLTAETQAKAQSLLSETAAFRSTLSPGLRSQRSKLEEISTDKLSIPLARELKTELAACLSRADWYASISIPIANDVAAIDRNMERLAEVVGDGIVRFSSINEKQNSVTSNPLGMAPTSLQFSRGSKYLLAYSSPTNLQILRSTTGQTIHDIPQIVLGCDIHDESDTAYFWHSDQRITAESLKPEALRQRTFELATESDIRCCRIQPNGRLLAYAEIGRVLFYDLQEKRYSNRFNCDGCTLMEWSKDGRWLAIVDAHFHIHVWDALQGECVALLDEQASHIDSLDWDPNNQFLICRSWDGSIQLCNVWSKRVVVRSKSTLKQLQFSNDRSSLGWNIKESKLEVVEWEPGLATELPFNSRLGKLSTIAVAFHPSLDLIAVASSESISFFDLPSNTYLASCEVHKPLALHFTPDGNELIVIGKNQLHRWSFLDDVETERDREISSEVPSITSAVISHDCMSAIVTLASGELAELDLENQSVKKILGPSHGFALRKLGNRGNCALYQWNSTSLEIWDGQNGELIHQRSVAPGALTFAAPDFSLIALTSSGFVDLLESKSFQTVHRLTMQSPLVAAPVAFANHAKEMAVQASASHLTITDTETFRPVFDLESNFSDGYTSLQFSPSDSFLVGVATGTNSVRVWNVDRIVISLKSSFPEDSTDWKNIKREREPIPHAIIKKNLQALQWRIHEEDLVVIADRLDAKSQLDAFPSDPTAINNYAWKLLVYDLPESQREEGCTLSAKAMQLAPNEPATRNTYALGLIRSRKLEEAERILQFNLEISPPAFIPSDVILLAIIEKQRGELSKSNLYYRWFEKTIQEHPPHSLVARREIEHLVEEYKRIQH